jgi:hypothetical protein
MDYNKKLRLKELGLSQTENILIPADAALVAGSHSLAQWMARNFNHNFDDYDRAIDAVYNSSHVGGSQYHHLIDGQHDILSAIKAVQDVKADDSFFTEVAQAGEHLLRDTASVSGINPIFSFTPEEFERLSEIVKHTGISKPFLADALTINAPELLGGSIALASSLVMGKKGNASNLSSLSGAYIVSALSSANPLLLPIAAGGLVYSLKNSEDKKQTLIKAGKGSLVSGSAIMVSGIIGGPVWLGCLAAVGTAVAVRYSIDNPEKAFERIKGTFDTTSKVLKRASLSYN